MGYRKRGLIMNASARILKDDLPQLVNISLAKKPERKAALDKEEIISSKKL